MDRRVFDEYIAGFNAADPGTFDRFIAEDLEMVNGLLPIHGREGMKEHYGLIWPDFIEHLTVESYVTDGERIAIEMWARFTAKHDAPEALFGPVLTGELFDFRGLIMYRVIDGQFATIRVAYNSFTKTNADGSTVELGIPH